MDSVITENDPFYSCFHIDVSPTVHCLRTKEKGRDFSANSLALTLHCHKLEVLLLFQSCFEDPHTWWSCFWPCFDSLDTKLNDSQSGPFRTEKCPYLTSQSLFKLLKCTSTFCPNKIPGHLKISQWEFAWPENLKIIEFFSTFR